MTAELIATTVGQCATVVIVALLLVKIREYLDKHPMD